MYRYLLNIINLGDGLSMKKIAVKINNSKIFDLNFIGGSIKTSR